ncbi:glycoside hydrolase family 31 protein [Subsaximicrobium wynnwilliamsii]|uniref:Glycoside hydrolase family 31 protein n=1 Tax=Subsaximicrobium wynnwilliamsii TaxID=291179 RepID=A0A5C6ZFN5_9FLAO|nr:glycoside hydrolase family 31 protein [Subsaximicrobium wynnwilliamsii]TXD82665.1 glycoside hydrolase family 31 protein [Subsaximicrobium wynnwilliamsii]TXD88400.1 glycoside hydrolase family 31 protein [Subsaximicrobium wynnwilliamsii]TXE02327.1 glycoside hydrolase family 31 protein [Subsaximicrobium wynnwilliamsii]
MNKIYSLILMFFIFSFSWSQDQLNVIDAITHKNKVVFTCENKSKISLEFLDSKNIKFWFSPNGEFVRNNESFAVINAVFDENYTINVNESSSVYEVFTEDLRVMVHKSPFKIQIFNKYQRLILGDTVEQPYVVDGTDIKTSKVLRQDEHFFGLGEKTGTLDRRGKSYTMWNSDKPCYSEKEDPLYKSIPFFMSSYNYGIFFDNTYKTQFDFGKDSTDSFSFSSPDGPFIYYFFYGKDYKEIIKSYTKLTGKPIMPPKWAFGWAQSRGLLTNETLTRDIAQEYRERNIPCDIIYQDIGWVEGLQNFEWAKEKYKNPKKMLSDLADTGFKVIVSQDPVVSQATTKQWEEADAKGLFATDIRTGESYDMPWPWGGNAGVVDFTNPKTAAWWGDLQQIPINDGVKGFWTDMGEPAWSNEESTDRLNMKHHLGMHDEIHNVYGLTWDKVVTEQFEKHNPNQRVFQMTRAAYSGIQRYAFGWSGDSGNGEDVTDGWANLANQIPLGLSAGLGLIPFWTTDISGYCGEITDYPEFAELYVRWLQFGIFNPLSRAHHEGNNAVEPWLFGKQAEKIAKASIELKYQLQPYLYSYARQSYDTGIPIMRALVLEYPKDENTFNIDDQFMFGEYLLIAPVVEEGAKTRSVYLPKGEWIDYNNPATTYNGGTTIKYPVTLETIPMFVKAGSIIPKSPIVPYTGALKNAPVILEIFPSNNMNSFELYEDDGETNNYKNDEFALTKIEAENAPSILKVDIDVPQQNEFKTEIRNYLLKIHTTSKPKRVEINSNQIKPVSPSKISENLNTNFKESNYFFDEKNQLLMIRLPDTKLRTEITIFN